jgi:triacylglycerol lipase
VIVPPRHPVVLVHGVLGFVRQTLGRLLSFAYFQGVEDHLREAGVPVHSVALPALGGVEARAKALKAALGALPPGKVNVIAHSMGGLDARWYVGRLGGHERVASLVTIATPHHGTAIADWGLRRLGAFAVEGRRFLEGLGVETSAFDDLTRDASERRNEVLLDSPEVPTVSYGGARPWYAVAAPLQVSFRILQRFEGPNDGLVSAASAKWGEYRGTVDADHFAQTGWHWTPPGLGRFPHLDFYGGIVSDLTARGF